MVYTSIILEQISNDKNPEASRQHKCSQNFDDLGMAQKFVIDYLIHVIEEGLRINFYNLDFTKSEFVELFERDPYRNWKLKSRHRSDLNGVSMLYSALYLPGYHQRVVMWEISSDDPSEGTEYVDEDQDPTEIKV